MELTTDNQSVYNHYRDTKMQAETPIVLGLAETLDLIPEGLKYGIDIGSGAGIFTERLAAKCEHVIGIDLMDWMVEHAKQNHNPSNVEYICADFMDVDLPENHFDAVLSMNCLLHIRDKKSVLEKIYKILKRGGTFALGDVTDRLNQTMAEGNHFISVQEYYSLLYSIGFTNVIFVKEENRVMDGTYTNKLFSIFKCSK